MAFKGAGGTKGGVSSFLVGLGMMAVGFYLLLSKIILTSSFGMGLIASPKISDKI